HGYGKRTELDEYRLTARGGLGVIDIQASDRNGSVVGFAYVHEGDEMLVITQQGMILRMPTNGVRLTGRATQGVTIIDLEENDKVVSIARLDREEEEGPAAAAPEPPAEPPAE